MATEKQIRERIAQIDAWLATGATSVIVDGVQTNINLGELRKERSRLERMVPEIARRRKPVAYRVNMGG
jgi:hypothetical protein